MFLKINRIEERKQKYHTPPLVDELKRKRELTMIELRKKKRMEHIAKKRAKDTADGIVAQSACENSPDAIKFPESIVPEMLSEIDYRLTDLSLTPLQRFFVLISLIQNTDSNPLLALSVSTLRKVLSEDFNISPELILKTELLKKLVKCLEIDYEDLQFNASWCLTNLTSYSTELVADSVANGIIEALIKILSASKSDANYSQAAWCLGNIAGDSPKHQDLVYTSGSGELIIRKIANLRITRIGEVSILIWSLSNLLKGPSVSRIFISEFFEIVPKILSSEYEEVLRETMLCLYLISEGNRKLIIDAGIIPRIIEILIYEDPSLKVLTLRTLGIIAGGDSYDTNILLNYGIIDKISSSICSTKPEIKKEALWCLSNLCACESKKADKILFHPIMKSILDSLFHTHFQIRFEASFVITNLTASASHEALMKFMEGNILEVLSEQLENKDSRILLLILKTVFNLINVGSQMGKNENKINIKFDAAGGITRLEALQAHPNRQVYNKTIEILSKFFDAEEDLEMSKKLDFNFS
ncbi:unnamed protein product [Blepharisma stoltei]|uniref:Importin subunit alpha n=1 Tax=Blepharisma stoltei TaxID=1481888 RepID=A0AAU9IPA5_9CILI|nr:unnamed protein product [Blepharisma stoltei]